MSMLQQSIQNLGIGENKHNTQEMKAHDSDSHICVLVLISMVTGLIYFHMIY